VRSVGLLLLSLGAVGLAACNQNSADRTISGRPQTDHAGIAVAPAAASPEDDGQWTMPAKDYANTRFSALSEINKGNVKDLQVAFTFSAGTMLGQESAPLVVGSTLYFVTPYPNILYAIDLTQPGGKLKWKFDPKPDASAQGMACCQPVNRGPTYADGAIFYNTVDTHTVAVDAATATVWVSTVL
jgi:lanthanide-dependent methanol dehydrogenase